MTAAAPARMIDRAERVPLADHAPHALTALLRFQRSIEFDPELAELVRVRASMLNGCAYCVDMHSHAARGLGEGDRRLLALAAWHESPLFDERERVAFALTDALTLLPEGPLDDEVYGRAAELLGADELAQLVATIAAINTWNRVVIASGSEFDPQHPQGV
jgi:AhpD family alkylhydroperoxidase